jgi:L-threonylcarbamoyladenylate synthase
MERIHLTEDSLDACVERAEAVLAQAGVILYPTDTLYGLGADAFLDEAVDKVYAIKGRDEKKPMHCIVADIAMAEQYAEFSDDARLLADSFFPGALTVILPKKPGLEHGIGRGIRTVGVRIPNNDFCLSLSARLGRPFTATSANTSGQRPHTSVGGALGQLGLEAGIDLVIDMGELPPSEPSTVVDFSESQPIILREGAIPAVDIWNAIRFEP